jgi:hypothetical protein
MQGSASFADLLRAWHDFYALVGAASATLVGLLFVAASIGSSYFKEEHRGPLGSFLTPTVVHFAAALFACLVACMPWRTETGLAIALGAGALAGLLYSASVFHRLVIRRRFRADLGDRFFYAVMPTFGYATLLIAAALFLAQSRIDVDALAAALLILLFAGIRNAWDMTLWTATKSADAASPP